MLALPQSQNGLGWLEENTEFNASLEGKRRVECMASIPATQGAAWGTGFCLLTRSADGELAYFWSLGTAEKKIEPGGLLQDQSTQRSTTDNGENMTLQDPKKQTGKSV